MPETVGGYWGTKQFARDLPLPTVRATVSGSTVSDAIDITPPPHEVGDTLLFIIVLRFDNAAVLSVIPSGLTQLFHYSHTNPGDTHDATQIFGFRKDVTVVSSTPYHFEKTEVVDGSFINSSCHSIIDAGPIENIQHQGASMPPKSIPAITTNKPNCLLVCGYTARWGLDQFVPMPPATPEWEGIGAAYVSVHWNAYQRNALIPGTYGPTLTESGYNGDQFVVMQVSPRPASPKPDLTLSALTPWSGVVAGGTTVTVTGTSFAVGATSVTIGSTTIPAGSVTVLSGTQLTFVTPTGPGAVKSVQAVTVTVGSYTSNKLSYTYNAAGGFSPASVSGVRNGMPLGTMDFWCDASEPSTVTRTGSNVTHWLDLSLNRYDFFGYNPAAYPQYTGTVQGRNVITCTNDILQVGDRNVPGERPRTYIFAVNPTAGVTSRFFGTGDAAPYIEASSSNTLVLNTAINVNTGVATTGMHIWTVEFNATVSRVWKDGTLVWTGNPGSFMQYGTWQTAMMTGVFAEFVSYRKKLSDTERADVENYMLARWTGPATAPDPPTLNTATAGNAQVTLAWTAPSYNGGSAITSYLVEKSPNGTSSWTTAVTPNPTASPATATSLTNGTIQYFRVSAVNAIGTGAASNVLSATPTAPTAPGAPTAVAGAPGNALVALTWTAPASNGGSAITDYVIQSAPSPPGTSWTTFTHTASTATSINVTGLTNGQAYVFRVAAVNAIGTGSYSTTSAAVTPASGGTWSLDFTDDALGISTDWTSRQAFRIGVANFSGTKKGCVVDPGDGSYVDWYWTRSNYNTALCTSVNQTMRVEAEFGSTGCEVGLIFRANAALSSYQMIKLESNGNWVGEYEAGGDGGNGTWTVPTLNTVFTIEMVVGPGNGYVVKINGATIITNTFGNTRTGLYGGIQLSSPAKMLRYYHGNT